MTDRIKYINISLIALSIVSLLFYIIQANAMTVQAWRSRDARERMTQLQNTRDALLAQKVTMSDRQQLTLIAQAAGMISVPADTVVYLIQDKPVAARSGF